MTQTAPRTAPSTLLIQCLNAAGVTASTVTRNRRTGIYSIQFRPADVTDFSGTGTDLAAVWAQRVQQALPGAEIIDTHDIIADWRPGRPVLFATVYVRLDALPEAVGPEPAGDIGTWH